MAALHHFYVNQDLLLCVFYPARTPSKNIMTVPRQLLHTIQAMLAPALLTLNHPGILQALYCFPDSQLSVYSNDDIFQGCYRLDINMEWVLHHINFWKYHMTRREEHTLFEAYEELAKDERPRFWSKQLKNGGGELGKNWKGSYAYVERGTIKQIRAGRGMNDVFQDEFNGDNAGTACFQDMQLNLVAKEDEVWPELFEKHLHSLPEPVNRARTRAQHRSASPDSISGLRPANYQFEGFGQDSDEGFKALGWLNTLPAQSGIPGWQRMTMMKYFFIDEDEGTVDEEALWAYEGVVLPGGQIIVGRWWCTSDGLGDDMYSGPFILWCVDGPKYDEVDEEVEIDEDNLP
jgi:hypothetical protein